MGRSARVAVLNPEGFRTVEAAGDPPGRADTQASSSMAPRSGDLSGKTVYLVDTGFGGSGTFLDEMEAWFATNLPSVTTVRRRKTGHVFGNDPKDPLWDEIKERGQAAVLGVAG